MSAFDWIHTSDDIWIKKTEIEAFWRRDEDDEGEAIIQVGISRLSTKDSVDDIARKLGLKRAVKFTNSDGFKPDTRFYRMNQVGPSIINKLYEMHGIKTVEELEERIDEVKEKTFSKFIEQFKEIKRNDIGRYVRMKNS